MSEQRSTITHFPAEQGAPYAPFDGVDPDIYMPARRGASSGRHPDWLRRVPVIGWLLE